MSMTGEATVATAEGNPMHAFCHVVINVLQFSPNLDPCLIFFLYLKAPYEPDGMVSVNCCLDRI